MSNGELWRSHGANLSLKPFVAVVEVISILALAALAIGAASTTPPVSTLEHNYPFVLGLEHGWCSPEFLEPVWGSRTVDAVAVCHCESRGRPTAVSQGVPYHGLFQIDASLHGLDPDRLLDPVYNSFVAAGIQERDGWGPWPVCARDLVSPPVYEPSLP